LGRVSYLGEISVLGHFNETALWVMNVHKR